MTSGVGAEGPGGCLPVSMAVSLGISVPLRPHLSLPRAGAGCGKLDRGEGIEKK